MRKDIYERMLLMKNDGVKPNYAELARRFDCDYRTAKKYYEDDQNTLTIKKQKPSLLDDFKDLIETKINEGCTAMSVYYFIKSKGFKGGYTIVREYAKQIRTIGQIKATIRFETNPGLQAQVDWKESLSMTNKFGEIFNINIFLTLLGYSRKKFIKLTLDRNQDTLIEAMIDSFKHFEGVPKEILFDNMKTVVNRSRTNYQNAVINETFYQFSKDMGFEVWSCRAYRPQTKGKVEALAKLMSRLQPYNNEFETIDELLTIVNKVMEEINNEVSQATGEMPNLRWKKEKEYLLPLPSQTLIDDYLNKPITRIVTKESMVVYKKNKYSLSPKYIGKTVTLEVIDGKLNIYLNKEKIGEHAISNKHYNYLESDYIEILKSDAFKFKDPEEIEQFAKKQMAIYDKI